MFRSKAFLAKIGQGRSLADYQKNQKIFSQGESADADIAPKLKKRTALFGKLREIFRSHVSQSVKEVIEKINPILRGSHKRI